MACDRCRRCGADASEKRRIVVSGLVSEGPTEVAVCRVCSCVERIEPKEETE